MEVILNPKNIKKRKVITYEEVKEGQCFVCDVDLGKDYPPVWIKTDRPLDNKQSCTLLTCGSRWYDIGRTGYFTEKTPVVLVNMICIATFDYEEQEEDEEDEEEEDKEDEDEEDERVF